MKLKILFTSCLLTICSIAFGQWNNTGTATLQTTPSSAGPQYRFSLGGKAPYYPTPSGLQGQILRVAANNSSVPAAQEPLVYGQFVFSDAQLARALSNGQATQLQIFNTFKRYSHGTTPVNPQLGVPSNNIPGNPSHTNSWAYDTIANAVKSTFNTGDAIGFFSRQKFSTYSHKVTLSSSSADNDRIGVVIAFVEDSTDLVTNYAFGLNSADFNWPIDVVHTTIPNQHSLTLFINRNSTVQSYMVIYDYLKLTQKTIANGSSLAGLYNTTANWSGNTVDIEVDRNGDSILVKRSQYSDAPGGKGSLAFPLSFTLNSDPVLAKFKGLQAYGYAANSQPLASYSNIAFSGSNNVIYDLRTGATYDFTGSGYTLNTSKNMYTDLGVRFYWRDTTEQTYGYIPPYGGYDVIVQPSAHLTLYGSASLNFPSTNAGAQSTLTISVPGALIGSPVVIGLPTSIVTGNYQFNGYVASVGVVSVTYQNLSGGTVDPNPGTFKVTVLQ